MRKPELRLPRIAWVVFGASLMVASGVGVSYAASAFTSTPTATSVIQACYGTPPGNQGPGKNNNRGNQSSANKGPVSGYVRIVADNQTDCRANETPISWNAQGPQGLAGTNGTNGNTILSGSGVPTTSTGANGDFYLDTTSDVLYGPKTSTGWPGTGTSLVGSQGTPGAPGPGEQTFSTPGSYSYTVPTGVSEIQVEIWGGGGGGGTGAYGFGGGGGGGAGGLVKVLIPVTSVTSCTGSVGGAGGAGVYGNGNGGNGGDSSITCGSTSVTGNGGNGGGPNHVYSGGGGGSGGGFSFGSGIPIATTSGGNGGAGDGVSGSSVVILYGNGGSGGGYYYFANTDGGVSGGSSQSCGTDVGSGGGGTDVGSGGGGASGCTFGGNGANGLVLITPVTS